MYTPCELIVHNLFSRLFSVNSESRKAIRRTLLRCGTLEARDVPAATLLEPFQLFLTILMSRGILILTPWSAQTSTVAK